MKDFLQVATFVLVAFLAFQVFSLKSEVNQLRCEAAAGFQAEREYTYPLLREIGEPEDNGRGVSNPILTNPKIADC